MWDKHLDLYLKYDNEDEFVEAYAKTIPDREIDLSKDATQNMSEMIAHEIDKNIIGKIIWMGRDDVLKRYYRTKKLERICRINI